jgi:HEAT repeat protein
MRSRFVFGVLFACGLVLVAACYLKSRLVTAPPLTGARETASTSPSRTPVPAAAPPLATPLPANGPPVVSAEDRQEAIDAEVERVERLGMNDDGASLSGILQALTNSEKEVRLAAIEATKQFGSTNAIPALKVAAENANDLKEKIAASEAVDFLSLPPATFDGVPVSLTPEQRQGQEQRRARRQLRKPEEPEPGIKP